MCVGTLSIWLQHVQPLEPPLERERFEQSAIQDGPDSYARRLANLNLLTYLIRHRDGRKSNFLMSNIPHRPHFFSIDNGLAFSGIGNPRPFITRWHRLKIDKLPRASVTRLKRLSAQQLRRHLETVTEWRNEANGQTRPASSFSTNPSPSDGVRRMPGMVQLGLTQREIQGIEARLRRLLERTEARHVQLF